jgi:type I restriction enzyme S subunit
MGDWKLGTVGDLVTLQRGIDLPSEQRISGNTPIMGSFGITGWHNTSACKGPGVTVGRSGASVGVVNYIDRDFWPLNTCLYVKDFKKNDPSFIYYLLKNMDLSRLNSGSAQPSLNRNFVHPVPVTFPDRTEQEAIGSILTALDKKIELNRQMNETLEAMARAIFKDWFVDFGPTRAKMAGAEPYLAPEIWSLFPDSLDNENKPEGWENSTIGAVSSNVRRGLSPAYVVDGGLLVLNQKCVRDRQINFSLGRRHDASKKAARDRSLKIYDVLINSTGVGTLGRAAQIWSLPEPEAIVDSHITVCRPDPSIISPIYYGLALLGQEAEFEALGEGSTGQTELARARVVSMPLLLPSHPIQKEFDEAVEPLLRRMNDNLVECQTLAATRDLLLPKLMSGEIRLRDARSTAETVFSKAS